MSTFITPEMITTDCTDPRQLADFWSKATGAPIQVDYDGFFVIVNSTPKLGFQLVENPAPSKNRIHIDFHTTDREATVHHLESIGATVQYVESIPDGSFTWTTLTDPEGNFFCVADAQH